MTNELGRRIFHYRMAGDEMHDVAERLGITQAVAARAFKSYATEVARDGDPEDRRAAVELEMARLDELMKCWWLDATVGGDARAAKVVLDTINTRIKMQGLDHADAKDPTVLQQILVVGQNQAEFIRSLEQGRKKLTGQPSDNGTIAGTVEEELTL